MDCSPTVKLFYKDIKNYMSFLVRTKIIHSNLPADQSYLDKVNKSMKLEGDDKIAIKDLNPNNMTKAYIKDQMNMALGIVK